MSGLRTRVIAPESREPIALPSGSEGVDGWLNRIAPAILRLGGDPNKMYDGRVREYLSLLRADPKELPEASNRWRKQNFKLAFGDLAKVMIHQALGLNYFVGSLVVKAFDDEERMILAPSLAGMRLVTDVGVQSIVDAFDGGVGYSTENFNYHGIGTGAVAPAVTDTALGTELTTQYTTDNTRATGTQSQPSANVYRSVGTNPVDATVAITEHGLLSQAATGGGDLFDRDTFTVINLSSGDSLETTYDGTFASGG